MALVLFRLNLISKRLLELWRGFFAEFRLYFLRWECWWCGRCCRFFFSLIELKEIHSPRTHSDSMSTLKRRTDWAVVKTLFTLNFKENFHELHGPRRRPRHAVMLAPRTGYDRNLRASLNSNWSIGNIKSLGTVYGSHDSRSHIWLVWIETKTFI